MWRRAKCILTAVVSCYCHQIPLLFHFITLLYQPTVYSVNAQDDLYPLLLQLGVPRSVRQICHKLAELGWLFRKVRAFIEGKKIEKTAGLVVQVGGGRGGAEQKAFDCENSGVGDEESWLDPWLTWLKLC